MSLLKEAKNLVRANANWAKTVYLNAVDVKQLDSNETSILIRNSTSSPMDYGSNQFHTYQGSIQVQIFLGLHASFDLEEKLIELLKVFNQEGWRILDTKPAIPDPDTHQLTATILVSKTKEAF
ncbi:DUF806 family protein [Weissella minor]|uniref:DUF806 family protein n=1 Tax=Weissella minor TaxID=1620 RepID=UPI003AF301C8